MHTEELFKEALQLSPVDRVRLMDLLFESFHHPPSLSALEMAWAEHAEGVCARIDNKEMHLHPLESVLSELNK